MKKVISSLPDFEFVQHLPMGADEHAALVKKDEVFAVCIIRLRSSIATAPNFAAEGKGVLSGPLTPKGLADILQWTDYETAAQRYRTLTNLPSSLVSLISDRRRSRR